MNLFLLINQHIWRDIQRKLRRVIDEWLEQIGDNSLTGACMSDISKWFDHINLDIL